MPSGHVNVASSMGMEITLWPDTAAECGLQTCVRVCADAEESENEATPRKARSAAKSARKSAKQAGLRSAIVH